MKSFLLAVGVFLALSLFIGFFTAHDIHAVRGLIEDAEALSAIGIPDEKRLDDFQRTWEKERETLSFSVNHQDLERVDAALSELLGAFKAEDITLYRQAAVVLVRAAEHLYHGIAPAWEHII